MHVAPLDVGVFLAFFAAVVTLGLSKSRRTGSEGYFLAGRSLPWWVIGVSIVAANISTEQFVGMAGQSAGSVGLAVSAWQLTGSIGIVLVAFLFLPRFLRAGIYTMPEFLEYRYNGAARTLMSVATVAIYATVTIVAVLYSGGLALDTIFGVPIGVAVWGIGLIALVYTMYGGLAAVAWADLIQGIALLAGGVVTMAIGLHAVGGWDAFVAAGAGRLHMILPRDHPELPWTVLVGGMWIPIFYYCGLNQFIVQRALAARDLRQGQLGVIFAGALWLIVPFAIVMPGMVSRQLYGAELGAMSDQAFPVLIRDLVPAGLRGFIFAAISGAVISSLASMLNSAATLFTMDIYARHLRRDADQRHLVRLGRVMTLIFLLAGCVLAPAIANPRFNGVFSFIQEFQGYISPGILAAFAFGLAVRRAPPTAGLAALLLSAPIYGAFQWIAGDVPYLHRMLWTFLILIATMMIITLVRPLPEPWRLPAVRDVGARTSPLVAALGAGVIAAVVVFFVAFR